MTGDLGRQGRVDPRTTRHAKPRQYELARPWHLQRAAGLAVSTRGRENSQSIYDEHVPGDLEHQKKGVMTSWKSSPSSAANRDASIQTLEVWIGAWSSGFGICRFSRYTPPTLTPDGVPYAVVSVAKWTV